MDFKIGISNSDTAPRFTGVSHGYNANLHTPPLPKKHHHHHHKKKTKSTVSQYAKPIASGLILLTGIALLPEAALASLGTLLTGAAFGPIVEGATIDYLANAAFVQAATRAGAVVAGSKAINMFGVFAKPKPSIIANAPHPLAGWTKQQVIEKAIELGLETPRDSLILWSGLGFKNGVVLSQDFARANGGMTLEMTNGGRWLNEMDLFGKGSPFKFEDVYDIWKIISTKTVHKASGQIRSVVGKVDPDSIYNLELREILNNPKITGIDELNIKPRVQFGRSL